MTALSSDRNTARMEGDLRVLPIGASQLIYGGAIVMRNAAGFAVEGVTATGLIGAGRAEERVDNTSGADGAKSIRVRVGTFRYANSVAGDLITEADIGGPAYAVDDQTVAKTSATNTRSVAGLIEGIDAQSVWVRFDPALTKAFLS